MPNWSVYSLINRNLKFTARGEAKMLNVIKQNTIINTRMRLQSVTDLQCSIAIRDTCIAQQSASICWTWRSWKTLNAFYRNSSPASSWPACTGVFSCWYWLRFVLVTDETIGYLLALVNLLMLIYHKVLKSFKLNGQEAARELQENIGYLLIRLW